MSVLTLKTHYSLCQLSTEHLKCVLSSLQTKLFQAIAREQACELGEVILYRDHTSEQLKPSIGNFIIRQIRNTDLSEQLGVFFDSSSNPLDDDLRSTFVDQSGIGNSRHNQSSERQQLPGFIYSLLFIQQKAMLVLALPNPYGHENCSYSPDGLHPSGSVRTTPRQAYQSIAEGNQNRAEEDRLPDICPCEPNNNFLAEHDQLQKRPERQRMPPATSRVYGECRA